MAALDPPRRTSARTQPQIRGQRHFRHSTRKSHGQRNQRLNTRPSVHALVRGAHPLALEAPKTSRLQPERIAGRRMVTHHRSACARQFETATRGKVTDQIWPFPAHRHPEKPLCLEPRTIHRPSSHAGNSVHRRRHHHWQHTRTRALRSAPILEGSLGLHHNGRRREVSRPSLPARTTRARCATQRSPPVFQLLQL